MSGSSVADIQTCLNYSSQTRRQFHGMNWLVARLWNTFLPKAKKKKRKGGIELIVSKNDWGSKKRRVGNNQQRKSVDSFHLDRQKRWIDQMWQEHRRSCIAVSVSASWEFMREILGFIWLNLVRQLSLGSSVETLVVVSKAMFTLQQ